MYAGRARTTTLQCFVLGTHPFHPPLGFTARRLHKTLVAVNGIPRGTTALNTLPRVDLL